MLPLEHSLLPTPQRKGDTPTIRYRSLQSGDFLAVKAAHAALFPIDYDDNFFHKATNGLDRIWSCAAFVQQQPYAEEQLVGFITAKTVHMYECEVTDRQHMGLLSAVVDHDFSLYILTLGVVEGFRHQGIAAALIQAVCQRAYDTRCRAVFLHVITYNTAAMNLYSRHGFSCMARLSHFYYIATGRQPDPNTLVYDAYLYVHYLDSTGGMATPWDMLTLAWSPVRSALGRIHSCMPGFCRQQQVHQYPASAAAPADGSTVASALEPSRSSSNSITSSFKPQAAADQQQQQVPPFGAPNFSRQRFKRGGCSSNARSSSEVVEQGQQQQLSLLPQAARYGLRRQQQQCEHIQQSLLSQRQQQQLYAGSAGDHDKGRPQQQRPQRMLQWLFNSQSRQGSMRQHEQQQQQQLLTGGQTSLQGQQHTQAVAVL